MGRDYVNVPYADFVKSDLTTPFGPESRRALKKDTTLIIKFENLIAI